MALIDSSGRRIDYLRLSVTEQCNLRCCYCMPQGGAVHSTAPLTDDQLLTVAAAAIEAGIAKIRITGGEPLLRKGIVGLISRISRLPGLRHLALTSNGTLLKGMATDLRNAGLDSLNVSLDSLQGECYSRITRGGRLSDVLEGLQTALEAGFTPIKLNVVILGGINDHEAADFAALTREHSYRVRFIECMPLLAGQGQTVTGGELLNHLSKRFSLQRLAAGEVDGPAVDYRIPGGIGTVGFITPLSDNFCGRCNRIRISSTGLARGCLFSPDVIDLRPLIESGEQQRLCSSLQQLVATKPPRHGIGDGVITSGFAMSRIGG